MLLPAATVVCALAAARCCPLEVLAGTSRPPVSLGSSSGCCTRGTRWHLSTTRLARVLKWMCVARCGGRCCARRRAARGDAAQGNQGYD
ncbi:hypothetical protein T492DRAFT_1099200, partial [Pavlovales sp. CCMP2436]